VLALVVAYENNSLLFVYYVYYTLLCHIILKIEIMSNTELMNLSVEQLRDLNKRIIEVVKLNNKVLPL
jgi:hypothetical protein